MAVVLGIGMACAVTALPILILFMEMLGILREPLGQRILRYASLDDIAIWGVLAFIRMDWTRIGRQAAFLAAFALVALALRSLMLRLAERDRWYVALIWLALCGRAADWSGLHFMVGAFLAGAVMDSAWFDQQQMDTLRHNVLLVMMPVFSPAPACARSSASVAPKSSGLPPCCWLHSSRASCWASGWPVGSWAGPAAKLRRSAGCCRPRH